VLGAGVGQARAASPTALQQATSDVHYTVRWQDYRGQYELQLQSLTRLGTVTGVSWTPPPSLRVSSITGVRGGVCAVTAAGGISCRLKLPPPTCAGDTCSPAPAQATVDFTATLTGAVPGATFSDLFWGSYLTVTGLTPAPPPYTDLPRCTKGHASTKRHPCTPT